MASLVRKGAGGLWYIRDPYRDPKTGKRKERSIPTHTTDYQVADEMRRAVERGEDARAVAPPDTRHLTVGRFIDLWLERKDGSVQPKTFHQYEWALRKHVKAQIGGLPLRELRDHHLVAMMRDLRESGLSDHSRHHIRNILGHALKDAVRPMRILNENPMEGLPAPAFTVAGPQPLTVEDANRFLAAAEGSRNYALWVLALMCGLRIGELVGLTWQRVDLDGAVVHVREQLHTDYDTRVGPLKTKSSVRDVPIIPEAVAILRAHRTAVEAEMAAAGLPVPPWVFPGPRGAPQRASNLRQRDLYPALARLGLGHFEKGEDGTKHWRGPTPHNLRDTFATLQAQAGVHQRVVQGQMGHANIRTTMEFYTGVTESMQAKSARALRQVLAGTKVRERKRKGARAEAPTPPANP